MQKKPNDFGYGNQKHNKKTEWIDDMTRELEGLEEGLKAEIHTDLLKMTLKKISNWKTPGHDRIHGFWLKNFASIHDRLALEMNKCLQTAHVPEWIAKEKTTLIQKDPNKGTAPKKLQTHNLPTNHVENINSINKGRDLLLANKPRFVPRRKERKLQRIQRQGRILYIDQHILNESKTRRKNLAMAWIDDKKGIWYSSA